MRINTIFLIIMCFFVSCGPSIAYGDYVNSNGMSRKQIEAIKNHPRVQVGIASYYGSKFHKKRTANGEIFNMYKISAAHKTLPLGTKVRVINLKNGKSLTMKINDRGPFAKGRIIDLSYKAAQKLGFVNQGTTKVRIEVIRLGDNKYYK
ncbi:MAG: septal ring lytic transglycosylase RlpA family protein [Candidatus Marinimicrobia bacterium]|nr:septal ring lytic transglycosylase RlpA family protein [Candidatus Neomarinimicrobiota bacterium]MBT3944062.1 septal ring lytic transglycosylase RlpA family protein [Candidatus Neomarinimicrobiota bacterium]MBT4112037.1 septal ring lytic transglycosylase RlpA family protein [Candidatus Neomarinimicrobiota bacterium]MBT4317234.1 septal ring lytic transglycosylase RlpA family protein [Candidatus Neomarinimicrobiota bacterium]MBT4706682.1 septal ring lytic transglycosylase RlpA family protein [